MGHSISGKLLGVGMELLGEHGHFWRWIILEDQEGVSGDGTLCSRGASELKGSIPEEKMGDSWRWHFRSRIDVS